MKKQTAGWIVVTLALVVGLLAGTAHAADGTWITDVDGNWTDGGKWSGGTIADGVGFTANFTAELTAATLTVTLNGDRTIGNITFTDGTTSSHNLTLSGDTLTLDVSSSAPTINVTQSGRTLTIGSAVAGNDGLTKHGVGTLALTGANSYTGTTTIQLGTLQLGNSTATGSLASTALVLSGGTLSYTRTGSPTQTFSTTDVNSGASAVSADAGNTLALGDITRSSGGTLTVGATGTITTSDGNDVTTGILGPWAFLGSGTSTRYATVSGGNIAGFTGTTGNAETDWVSAAVNYELTTTGTRTLTAGRSVNTLRYSGGGIGAIALNTGLDLTANGILAVGSGTLTISRSGTGTVIAGSTGKIIIAGPQNVSISAPISSGSVIYNGTGVYTPTGNNTYAGVTYVNSGRLDYTSNNTLLGTTAGNTVIASGATLRTVGNRNVAEALNIAGTGVSSAGALSITVNQLSQNGAVTLSADALIRSESGGAIFSGGIITGGFALTMQQDGSTSMTVQTAAITGAGSLMKTGTGTLNLNIASSYSGGTTLSDGTLNIGAAISGSNSAIGSTSGQLTVNGGTLNMAANNVTVGNLTGSGGVISGTSGTRTLTIGQGDTGGGNFQGQITNGAGGTNALTKTGSGTITLSGNNTYTGVTTITGGTLKLGANDVIPNTSNVSIGTATLDVDTRTDTAGTLDVTGAAVINLGSGAALAFADSKLVDWTGGTLNITGTLGATSLRFGDSADDLTSGPGSQLAKISVNGSGLGTYILDVNGYLVSGGDVTAPMLSTTDPANSASGVAAGANLVATFSENIAIGTGNITLRNLTDATQADIDVTDATQVSISGAVLTINPTLNLLGGKNYAVQIAATAIEDLSGNSFDGIANDSTWNFTTATPDTTAPTLSSLNPADNATDVPIGANLVATFSENIAIGTGNIILKNLTDSTQADIDVADAQIAISGAVLTINPTANLLGEKNYAVQIAATAIDDLSGNRFDGIADDIIWNFTTATPGPAATLYFDGGDVDIDGNGDGASAGGTGTWNTTIKNWDAGAVPYVAWNNASVDDAVIAGSGILNVGEAVTVGTLTLSYTSGTRTVSNATITVNSGINFGSPASLTWTARIVLGGNQTWSHGGSNNTDKKFETGGTDLNGHELTYNSSNTGTGNTGLLHRKITGTGSIVKNGTGWVLIGGGTGQELAYTGSTTVNAGTLFLDGWSDLGNATNQLTVNGGTLDLRGNNLTVGNLTGTGGVIDRTSNQIKTLTIGHGNFGGGHFQGSIRNTIGTTHLTKTGTGTITLSGVNTYTGATTINGGTLLINGSLAAGSAVNVVAGTLGGSGIIGGSVTVQASGNVSPGSTGAGTLNVGGNLDILAMAGGTGKLKFELGAPGTSDRIAVTGTLAIGDGALGLSDFEFTNLGGMAAGTYTLITSVGGISGTPDKNLGPVGLLNNVKLDLDGNNLVLIVPLQEPQPSVFRFR